MDRPTKWVDRGSDAGPCGLFFTVVSANEELEFWRAEEEFCRRRSSCLKKRGVESTSSGLWCWTCEWKSEEGPLKAMVGLMISGRRLSAVAAAGASAMSFFPNYHFHLHNVHDVHTKHWLAGHGA